MKLRVVGVLGIVLGATASIGCGPGLGHHGGWVNSAKSANDATSTTALTSDDTLLQPHTRVAPVPWDDPWAATQASPSLQTWGAAPKPEDQYGF